MAVFEKKKTSFLKIYFFFNLVLLHLNNHIRLGYKYATASITLHMNSKTLIGVFLFSNLSDPDRGPRLSIYFEKSSDQNFIPFFGNITIKVSL